VQVPPEQFPEKPRINWFALTDSRTVKITFTQPMITWTIENPLNYYIGETVAVTSLHAENDTLELHLGGLFSQNVTYHLSIKHLLAQNMAFMNDTIISFLYPYKVEQKPLLAWTFDYLQSDSNSLKRVSADYHLLDTVSEAILFCDGTYQSSAFLWSPNNSTQINVFTGTIVGDPRPNPIAGNAIAFANETANGKSVVFKFPTKGYFNLSLSMAVRKTATGFNSHEWEWSLDGENYTLIENTATCPIIDAEFVLTTLDLRTIDELNDQYEVFLRLTFDGGRGATGNNRFDNITLHGVSIYSNNNVSDFKQNNRFFIAPNPNQGQFQIIHHHSTDYYHTDYIMFNSFGQVVKVGKLDGTFIDISHQPNGIYFLKIGNESFKVIKY
jgi:hypothetical protein